MRCDSTSAKESHPRSHFSNAYDLLAPYTFVYKRFLSSKEQVNVSFFPRLGAVATGADIHICPPRLGLSVRKKSAQR